MRRRGGIGTPGPRHARGVILLTVLLTLVLTATIAFLLNYEGAINVDMTTSENEASEAEYLAQAGLQHAVWLNSNNSCAGDATLSTTPFGAHSYDTTITAGGTTTGYQLPVDQDSWIKSDDATADKGNLVDQHVRFESGVVEQAVFRFDLSPVPAGARINSATAWFYVESGQPHPEGPITIHRVTADWTETGANWETLDGQFDSQVLATIPAQAQSDVWVRVNLTAQVQAWVNGQPNYGILFSSSAEGIHGRYISREGTAGQQPRLDVIVGTSPPSPATITATGTLTSNPSPANDIDRTLTRIDAPAYQPGSYTRLQPGAASGKDAEIWDQAPNNNYGNIAETWVSSASNDTTRTLLRFNMGEIPVGARILAATLSLKRQSGSGADQPVSAHRITNPWSEDSVTWKRREPSTNWDTAGGDFDTTAVATTPVGPANKRYEWNITPLVQGWVDGSYPNYGVALTAAIAGMPGERFNTSDHADPSLWPSLSITYSCECGSACMPPQGVGKVLMVIGDSPFNPNPEDAAIRAYLESWGYSVTLIQDDDSQGNFDAGVAANDVVFISESTTSGNVNNKLTNAPIGVVTAESKLTDELGLSTGNSTQVGHTIDVVDSSHYITQVFPTAPLRLKTVSTELYTVAGTTAPGAQVLANVGGVGGVVALDTGAAMAGGGTAAGRRVFVPIGEQRVDWSYLTADGRLIVQRALQWGTGKTGGSSGPKLLLVVVDPSSLTTQETAKKVLIESWGWSVNLIDQDDNQAAYDTAITENEVVFITEDVSSGAVGTKLVDAPIGVVTEEDNLSDEFGLSDSIHWGSGTELTIDNRHYITAPLAMGPVTILTSSESLADLTGAFAPDLRRLGNSDDGIALASVEAGASVINGGIATGRRVQLPWGGDDFDVNHLNADGLTIFRRSLEWASGMNFPGPIAHWKLDETSGTTAVDSVGGHDGTLVSDPTWGTGVFDGGLELDGVDDYVDVGTFDVSGSGLTLMGWFNADAIPTSDPRIISKADGDDEEDAWWQLSTTDSGSDRYIRMRIKAGGTTTTLADSSTNLTPGNWYFAVATYHNSSGQMRLYLDGTVVASGTHAVGGPMDAGPTVPVAIGANGTAERFFEGVLDDVRIYDRALSAAEIAELAVRPPAIVMSTDSDATLGGLAFTDNDLAEYKPSGDSATLFFDGSPTTLSSDIDALHVLENGNILLSTKDSDTLGGLSFVDGDLVEYDPATDTATLFFDESAFSGDEDIRSVYLMDNGHLLLSTDSDATLGGLNFTDNDLVEYDPVGDTATLYFDGSTTTLTSDIDAVHLLENGNIVLSTKDDATLGGLSFKDGDLVEYDPVGDTATLYFDEASFGSDEDLISAHVGPGSGSGGAAGSAQYVEAHEVWWPGSSGSWETVDLTTYGVPAGAIVEILITNNNGSRERWGGARAMGSSLERRFRLHEAEGGGNDAVVMHVQTDASSRIEQYAEHTNNIVFTLLGYWTGASYVERFDSFAAGGSGSWRTHNLGGYGVGANQVAEIALVNTNTSSERLVGVRPSGASMDRRIDIHEAESGGVDVATMIVNTDATSNVEVYAESDSDIDFYVLGYWSTPPGTYTETGGVHGQAAASGVWHSADPSGWGLPANSVGHFLLSNEGASAEQNMGIRQTGSSQNRLLDLQEAESGGADTVSLHVNIDASIRMEIYSESVGVDWRFYPLGWWILP